MHVSSFILNSYTTCYITKYISVIIEKNVND